MSAKSVWIGDRGYSKRPAGAATAANPGSRLGEAAAAVGGPLPRRLWRAWLRLPAAVNRQGVLIAAHGWQRGVQPQPVRCQDTPVKPAACQANRHCVPSARLPRPKPLPPPRCRRLLLAAGAACPPIARYKLLHAPATSRGRRVASQCGSGQQGCVFPNTRLQCLWRPCQQHTNDRWIICDPSALPLTRSSGVPASCKCNEPLRATTQLSEVETVSRCFLVGQGPTALC